MFLGLLFIGMTVGAGVAGAWLVSGGSILVALLLYSVVATAVVLGISLLSFALSDRTQPDGCARVEPMQPAE